MLLPSIDLEMAWTKYKDKGYDRWQGQKSKGKKKGMKTKRNKREILRKLERSESK